MCVLFSVCVFRTSRVSRVAFLQGNVVNRTTGLLLVPFPDQYNLLVVWDEIRDLNFHNSLLHKDGAYHRRRDTCRIMRSKTPD